MARLEMTYKDVSGYFWKRVWMYLVGVHIALGSTTCLENDEREVVNELAGDDLDTNKYQCVEYTETHIICCFLNSVAEFWVKTIGHIDCSCGFFEDTKCFDEG